MKTRYKIILVIGLFALVYMQIPWMLQTCISTQDMDCSVHMEMMRMTRLVVFTDESIWNTEDVKGIGNWTGTADGIEQNHTMLDYLRINQDFILTMILAPSAIIAITVLWDKKILGKLHVIIIGSVFLAVVIYLGIVAYAEPEDLCHTAGGIWDERFSTCDKLNDSVCTAMGGEFIECKPQKWRCPDLEKGQYCTDICTPTCQIYR